jgi:hypothetical protein
MWDFEVFSEFGLERRLCWVLVWVVVKCSKTLPMFELMEDKAESEALYISPNLKNAGYYHGSYKNLYRGIASEYQR